jgi:hypothetical protein
MMETLRQRQLEIANKIGLEQKLRNATAAGQAQADGTLTPVPDAGFMQQMAPVTPQ